MAVCFFAGLVIGGLSVAFAFAAEITKFKTELYRKSSEVEKLESDLHQYDLKLDTILKTDKSAPPDCKEGPWCAACDFVKYYHVPYHGEFQPLRCCGKGEACKHFVQKEKKDGGV